MREPKPLFGRSGDTDKVGTFVYEWLALPMSFVVFSHISVWLIGSFVAWDFGWISFLGHRFLFVMSSLGAWGSVITIKWGDDK